MSHFVGRRIEWPKIECPETEFVVWLNRIGRRARGDHRYAGASSGLMWLSTLVTQGPGCHPWYVVLDRNGLRILNLGECVALLGAGCLGRIALSKIALPTIMPVLYKSRGLPPRSMRRAVCLLERPRAVTSSASRLTGPTVNCGALS